MISDEKRDGVIDLRGPDEAERMVFDAEIVDDQDERPGKALKPGGPRRVITTLGSSGTVATTGRMGRKVARGVWVAGQGGISWMKRGANAATHGVEREQIRLARMAGDREALAQWHAALQAAKTARFKRLTELPRATFGVLVALGAAIGVALFLLVAIGVTVSIAPGGLDWASWWAIVGAVLGGLFTAAKALAIVAAVAVVPVLVWLAWREGHRVADPPVWLLTTAERAAYGTEVTPSKVVTAFRDLGIPELRKKIKEMADAGAGMVSPIVTAGCGVELDVALPSGVSTADIQKPVSRRRLAENLDRHEHEVHISIAPRARTIRLWIADSGALDEPVGPSPLVLDETPSADVYTGRAPWGHDLRGDAVLLSLLQRHVLVTGLSNQGKTAAARALALWLIFDVTAELRIGDLKGIGDWHMFAPIATVLIEGPADEHVVATTEMLEDGVAEMERRLTNLDKEKYPNGVTRQLARQKGSGYHPLFLIVDEGQVGFMCPAIDEQRRPYGGTKANSRYFNAARKLLNQGRAVNVMLWMFTQDPTDENLPKLIREAFHVRCSLVVGTVEQAVMAVGKKAVDAGAAPHMLRQGIDKGVLVVAGDGVPLGPGQSSLTVRTHFIDGTAATGVAQRGVEHRRHNGRHLTVVESEPEREVDYLADIQYALRDEPKTRTTVVLGRLIEDDPETYESWDLVRLTEVLEEARAPTLKSNGVMHVVAERVAHAIAREAEEGPA